MIIKQFFVSVTQLVDIYVGCCGLHLILTVYKAVWWCLWFFLLAQRRKMFLGIESQPQDVGYISHADLLFHLRDHHWNSSNSSWNSSSSEENRSQQSHLVAFLDLGRSLRGCHRQRGHRSSWVCFNARLLGTDLTVRALWRIIGVTSWLWTS